MASRKRQRSLFTAVRNRSSQKRSRDAKRRHLVETLEQRQLLAGPQLIGIQPNEGALIADGSVREISPRLLTFRFDEDQQISAATTDAIQFTRAGADEELGTSDDIRLDLPDGSVSVNPDAPNEVLVRFPNALPDDRYRIEVFGFDDPGAGIVGLRNVDDAGNAGELLIPSEVGARKEQVDFELRLGPLVEAVVPQPVVRDADGNLQQRRDQVVVYFNEDELFIEDDDNGDPTLRSAENPRFYQLLHTRETVRTTDDEFFQPTSVDYDPDTHTATLTFADDLSELAKQDTHGAGSISGGTFRLRVGTAVDDRSELVIQPTNLSVVATATSDLRTDGAATVRFVARSGGEAGNGISIDFERTTAGGVTARVEQDRRIVVDLGSGAATVTDVRDAIEASPDANALIEVVINGDPLAAVGAGMENVPALQVVAVGDTLQSAFDVGTFGESSATLTSTIVSESIDPQPFRMELLGGNDDPGHLQLEDSAGQGFIQHLSELFTPDVTSGVTTIPYNFAVSYGTTSTGLDLINSITDRQQERVREALNLWSNVLGVQFAETADQGIQFVLGDLAEVSGAGAGTRLVNLGSLDMAAVIDPSFNQSQLVLDSQRAWRDEYGEDFLRTATAGIGVLLGLEEAVELPASTLMNLSPLLLNRSINSTGGLEPIFPGNFDVLHGQYLHNPDSNDVDLYRFEVDLGDDDKVGMLTAETFAERLSDSSLLDTTLTLFEQVQASVTTDFGLGTDVEVRFEAIAPARLGNRTQIEFAVVTRPFGDESIGIIPTAENAFRVEIPRQNASTGLPETTVGEVLDAIHSDPFASTLVRGEVVKGSVDTDIAGSDLNYSPLVLTGGRVIELARNDDYFSEDSLIRTNLGNGTYYIGVAASGNNHYDPTLTESGLGGRTQGDYDLQLVFKAQVDKVDVIRDLDSGREGVPGVRLDGDGDGAPGGVYNFWFQTRPEQRQIEFTAGGDGLTPLSTMTVTGSTGTERTFQFVPAGGTGDPRFVPVSYIEADTPTSLAIKLSQAINSVTGSLGVSVNNNGSVITFGEFVDDQPRNFERSIDLSNDFVGMTVHGKTIFVDKLAGPDADGSLAQPFNNIAGTGVANAFAATEIGDIVRIVGNGGSDLDTLIDPETGAETPISTPENNFAYEFGFAETGGDILEDGVAMEVPRGVTTMIDAGAIFRFRNSRTSVGSSDLLVNRSGGAMQVLGTPRLLDSSGNLIPTTTGAVADGQVIFTSTRDRTAGQPQPTNAPMPAPGDWGGLVFRSDFDDPQGRRNLEDQGIFLQYVNHADIRYGGGGNVKIGGFQQTVNPIQVIDVRPTITFNEITDSASAAMSAAPNSFEETNYQTPRFQQAGSFTSDYDRVGPNLHHNELVDNSINGMFIRIDTLPGQAPRELTLAGRLDDVDVVHVLSENLIVRGTPGGSITDGVAPQVDLINAESRDGGTLAPGDYRYRMTFVDANGFESLPSTTSGTFSVAAGDSALQLANLPPTPEGYVARRIYRASASAADPNEFVLVTQVDASSTTYFDEGLATEGVLDTTRAGTRGRLDASLVFDPGLVTKLIGSRIELTHGSQLLAEGLPGREVVFTSSRDDRFGGGGTFDTNNDGTSGNAQAADWGGIYAGPGSHISLDNSVVAFGGGLTRIEGTFKSFNPIELQQGTARIANSFFEDNADGQGGQGPNGRFGRLANTPATIFVRGSQPTILNNTFVNNGGSVIDIDVNSMTSDRIVDLGRQTGDIDRFARLDDNHGPLIRDNRLANNDINGMEIRATTLTTESVWDDTDIVHVLFGTVVSENLHSKGGLRLQSRPDESLVVKFSGSGSPYEANVGTGLTANGTPSSIEDRVGGTLQVLGQPGFPVVLTSLNDDTVGAGVTPDGRPQTDTNNDQVASRPASNDWRGLLLDQFSNDRNVETVLELESSTIEAPGTNATTNNAQVLGDLAPNFYSSDEILRLGFTVHGYLSAPTDVDVYNFTGEAGTVVWFDVDNTTFELDTVIELLDSDGNVLVRSDNSTGEVFDPNDILVDSPLVDGRVGPLARGADEFAEFGAEGLYKDYGTINPRDAGFRVALPGVDGSRSAYSFRVRSASVNPADAAGGTTSGAYSVQLRLREDQEFGGSVVRYADIRYANHGVRMRGVMQNSPLLGDAQENENVLSNVGGFVSNDELEVNRNTLGTEDRPQYLGNLLETDDASLTVGGLLSSSFDVDFYEFAVDNNDVGDSPLQYFSTVFDVDYADGLSRPDTSMAVFWDPDGEANGVFNPDRARLVLWSEDSNIAEDQTSPLGPDGGEFFDRGSVGTRDAFIGPVALPATGVYYVAMVSDSQAPLEFNENLDVRREPIPSVVRIADDGLNRTGGATAAPPVVPVLIPRTGLPSGWAIDNRLSGNRGHGAEDFQQFDNTDSSSDFGPLELTEFESNDPQFSQALSLDAVPEWNLRYDGDVGNAFGQNTSLEIPYIKVDGRGDGTIDGYRFTVPTAGTVILDIDDVVNGFTQEDDESSAQAADLQFLLVNADGDTIGTNANSGLTTGAGGSLTTLDPFFEGFLPAGTYFLGVGLPDIGFDAGPTDSIFDNRWTGEGLPDGLLYDLNVSIETKPAVDGPTGNESLHYAPTGSAPAVLTTNAFDLGSYTAEDQPYLYFNYFRRAGNLQVNGVLEDGTRVALPVNLQGNTTSNFLQERVSLDGIVGENNVRLEFIASGGLINDPVPSISLDDFVIGFAERGERISGAAPGRTDFAFVGSSSSILDGEYQLEIRPGQDYSAAQFATPQKVLTQSFDTNARLAKETVTIFAPEGRQLADQDFFELSDGATTVRFEFNSTGGVALGSIPVPFTAADPDYVVAQSIRNAINNPNVQAILNLEASSSGGIDNAASNDNRIDLVGPVDGDFVERSSTPIDVSLIGDAATLATTVAGPGVTVTGNQAVTGGNGTGAFTEGASTIGLEEGVVLSTGSALTASGPNISETTGTTASGSGDVDLDAATGISSFDSSSLEFDFQVEGTTPQDLFLEVVYASEEFIGDAPVVQDKVAVLVEDLLNGTVFNLGLVGTQPLDSVSVGPGTGLFNDNSVTGGGDFLREFGFDGFSQVLTLSSQNTDIGGVQLQPGRDYRMKVVIGDAGTDELDSALFIGAQSMSTTMPLDRNQIADPVTGRVTFPAVLLDARGDRNVERTQSQVLIDSNTISHSHVYGVYSEPADRGIDPFDTILGLDNELLLGNQFIQTPRLGNSGIGAVRNLPAQNDSVTGGLAPGVTVVNNIIDGAQLAGINIEGELRPWVVEPIDQSFDPDNASNSNPPGFEHFSEWINDGDLMAVDAGRTRVVFEFDDIQNDVGVRPGHVPIYYRDDEATGLDDRDYGYNKHEVLLAMREAILGSALVQNDMVQLVEPIIADNMFQTDPSDFNRFNRLNPTSTNFQEPVLYLYGASNVEFFLSNDFDAYQASVHDGVQPFARVINNTIVGRDGTLASVTGAGIDEPNDTLENAVETRQGVAHRGDVYTTDAVIGDSQLGAPTEDVDFYKMQLDVGDRAFIDIDTGGDVDTVLRLFNSSGQAVTFYDAQGNAQTVSDTATAPGESASVDPYIDFTATEKDTYYVAVSASGNETYDALSLGQRLPGSGTGAYTINIEVLAPRQFVLNPGDGETITPGSTFTIRQVADLRPGRVGAGADPTAVTFQFVLGNGGGTGNNIPVRYNTNYTAHDMAVAIASAINGSTVGFTPLPNYRDSDFVRMPDGRVGPIDAVEALALGGSDGLDGFFIENYLLFGRPHHAGPGGSDSPNGLGFNWPTSEPLNGSPADGRHEVFVVVNNAAEIEVDNPGQVRLDPVPGRDNDQIIPEAGILATQGASPTLLNNVIINTNGAVINEESRALGFGPPSNGTDVHPKKGEVIVGGSIFHATEAENLRHREIPRFIGADVGIELGPTNTNTPSDDFNYVVPIGGDVLADPLAGNFLPIGGSLVVDSAIDSLPERAAFASLKQSLGIAVSPILAPTRDNSGLLRADDPDTQTPSGLGANVFKDRGAVDLADFVGPIAVAATPEDNDAEQIDQDPAVSFLQLSDGSYSEFRIQLIDTGDASDPFPGSGINDDTVVGPDIDGLRREGAAVTVFENGRLLEEGIDYTFRYDSTKNLIRLTPLAGIWRNDRSYRISLNNEDRFVVIAPPAGRVRDGERLTMTDEAGGVVSLEFESGYEIELPEVLTLVVPQAGTGAGGIGDADSFTIDDGTNPPVTFEFDSDDPENILSGSVRIAFEPGDTPAELATAIADAIAAEPGLDVSVALEGDRVRIGAESGAVVDAFDSGLNLAPRTIALQPPQGGTTPGGIADGDRFTINDGQQAVVFEFETGGGVGAGNVGIPVAGATDASLVATAIMNAVESTNLNVKPRLVGDRVLLGLPSEGSASAGAGQLRIVGLAQTPADGTTLTFTPAGATDPVVFELNRTDLPVNDGVDVESIGIDFDRSTTAGDLAEAIAAAIVAEASLPEGIPGVNPSVVDAVANGFVAVGGEEGLQLTTSGSAGVVISGQPGVTESTSLQIFGELELQLPPIGPIGIPAGTQFTLSGNGETAIFEYTQSGFTSNPNAIAIVFSDNDSLDDVTDATVTAINSAVVDGTALGITAQAAGPNTGTIELGQLQDDQIDVTGTPLATRRGVVEDGDYVVITQGGTSLLFEFNAASGGGGTTQPDAIEVRYQASASPAEVAAALASAIRNNLGALRLDPVAVGDTVRLNDVPGTTVDIQNAPRLLQSGVPGGAQPVRINRSFDAMEVKQALIDAINSINDAAVAAGQAPFTNLVASDRGGNTLFVENARMIGPQLENYFLQAISDNAGRDLKPNRGDNTTQFTLLMPEVSLDFGDAPDPVGNVRGRYPTLFDVDGARHVIGLGPVLGSLVDGDADGQPTANADGDDTAVEVIGSTGTTFVVSNLPGELQLSLGTAVDGDTLTLDTGTARATFEYDDDGRFDEDNYAVEQQPGETIAAALERAVRESPLQPAGLDASNAGFLRFIVDDEDGVDFVSASNPSGVFNKNFSTPVTVTVTGAGVLEAWIDFNGDGDWNDPGEQVISAETPGAVFGDGVTERIFNIPVPNTTAEPNGPLDTFARFRLSAEGGLNPTGLALSGEVEDYAVRVLPGAPPVVNSTERTYTVREDNLLEAFDADGGLTTDTTEDDGVLAGIFDPNGQRVEVFAADVGVRRLEDATGAGGVLDLEADGTFRFTPDDEFFGPLTFTFRATDIDPGGDTSLQLINPNLVTVTLNVEAVNDPPRPVAPGPVVVEANLNEDQVEEFSIEALTDGLFLPGPPNESDQGLRIDSVGSDSGTGGAFVPFVTEQGGTLQILANGSVQYEPPLDYNTEDGRPLDRFVYTVADVPVDGQASEAASERGTVVITLDAVNDPPIAVTDNRDANEDSPRELPLFGPEGILENDLPGPSNESDQTISLITADFPLMSQRGGTVTYTTENGGLLIYTPVADFSGQDQFTYRIEDSEGATASGTVILTVDGENDAAEFIGINGVDGRDSLSFTESKETPQVFEYDLNTWFVDPEGDPLSYSVTSSDAAVAVVSETNGTLTLTLPSYGFGEATVQVTATNVTGEANPPSTTVDIAIEVEDTPDPPRVLGDGFPDELEGEEDVTVLADLSQYFEDPDRTQLSYRVISPANLESSTLIESIEFVGDQMQIFLKPDANGSQQLTIGASDGTFEVSDTFTLVIEPVQDAPVGGADSYDVSIGGRRSVLDPTQGLLANDNDPDGDAIEAVLESGPTQGELLEFNADGTFVYQNRQGDPGETDTFTYRVQDSSGLSSSVTVTMNLTRSDYQNPIEGQRFDVTADGDITALDALRVIRLLNREGSLSVPVGDIGAPPPDYVDVNGDGRVEPRDALDVINELNRRSRSGRGQGEAAARFGTTVDYAAADRTGLPETNVIHSDYEYLDPESLVNQRPEFAFTAIDGHVDSAVEVLAAKLGDDDSEETRESAVDEALSSLFGEISVEGL